MRKVLIFPDFDKFGGTRTFLKNLIDFYRLNDYQIVTVVEKESCDKDIFEFLIKNNCKILFLSGKYRKGKFLRFHIVEIFIDLILGIPIIIKERPELVVISTGFPGKFLSLMLLFPMKLIYILHTSPTSVSKINRILLQFSFIGNKRILTVSKFSKNQILYYWLNGKKEKLIHYVYNFSNLEDKPHNLINNRKKDTRSVLTLGHVRWYKNPEIWYTVALKTIEKCHGTVEFFWAGDGDLLNFFRDKIKKANITNIKFLGFQANIIELYNHCDIYFQPSIWENHSIAVADAMMMGLPCVVSSAGGLPESVVDGKTGYVIDPNDTGTMADKILNLLENENLRKSMGEAGKEYYLNNFSHERWIKEMKAFHEMLG